MGSKTTLSMSGSHTEFRLLESKHCPPGFLWEWHFGAFSEGSTQREGLVFLFHH